MRLDYSPAEIAALPSARRSFLIAALVLVSVGAAMSRSPAVVAPEQAPAATAAIEAPAAVAPETLATPAASP